MRKDQQVSSTSTYPKLCEADSTKESYYNTDVNRKKSSAHYNHSTLQCVHVEFEGHKLLS